MDSETTSARAPMAFKIKSQHEESDLPPAPPKPRNKHTNKFRDDPGGRTRGLRLWTPEQWEDTTPEQKNPNWEA